MQKDYFCVGITGQVSKDNICNMSKSNSGSGNIATAILQSLLREKNISRRTYISLIKAIQGVELAKDTVYPFTIE